MPSWEIHPGSGGTEAQDRADVLLRMYNVIQVQGFKVRAFGLSGQVMKLESVC